MTLQVLLNQASETLKNKNVEDPSLEAGLLLSWAISKELGYVYAHRDFIPSEEQIQSFWSAIERRGCHEPFAYITGECEFLSLSFEVNPSVLIPRPDTELLAEAALKAMGIESIYFNQTMFRLPVKECYRVLDVGTGSGCLAVSVAKNASFSKVDAIDISREALETAKHNAARHLVLERVQFIQIDFLKESSLLSSKYDLILSNPPYIPYKEVLGLMPTVRDFEPHTALVGGEDGLVFYRDLAEKAHELLTPQGIMAVECGFDQAFQIQTLFSQNGLETLLLKDISGINRVVVARGQV